MGCQGSKAAVATQQPIAKTLLAGDTSPKKLALAIERDVPVDPFTNERDVPAEAKIELPKHLTLTKTNGSPVFIVGSTVSVVEEFEAISDSEVPTMLKKGCLGVVCEFDEEGDAHIEFSQDGETFDEWVDQADFPKLRLAAVIIGCTVEVLEEFEGISDECMMLKKGCLGVVLEIDEDGDARIEFSQVDVPFVEWVDAEDFPKLQMKAWDFPFVEWEKAVDVARKVIVSI